VWDEDLNSRRATRKQRPAARLRPRVRQCGSAARWHQGRFCSRQHPRTHAICTRSMWRLPQVDRRRYPRNSLEVVLAQVRFHPILKLPSRIGEFQEHVRERFPSYADEHLKSVEVFPDGTTQVRSDQLFRFASVLAPRHIQLTTTSLTLEVRDYNRREDLSADFSLGLHALTKGVGVPSFFRLGLRFVNAVSRERIGADLGREVTWSELVTEDFLRTPRLFDADLPRSYHELTAPLTPGALTFRYGLLPTPQASDRLYFRFDMDRYLEGVVDASGIPDLLAKFTDDCFALFESASATTLREWMEQSEPKNHGA